MLVMPSNNTGIEMGRMVGMYPNQVGHLLNPTRVTRTYEWLPFAVDNGRFAASACGKPWDGEQFVAYLHNVASMGHAPLWVVVPDVVGDADQTLRSWGEWSDRLSVFGWPLALAVQDGMTPQDVPSDADVIFVGGSTDWKRRTMSMWCEVFDRVHVGRINTERWLWECDEAGAESCDGTGWFRGRQAQLDGLLSYLSRSRQGQRNPRGAKLWN
jgi:hypothetical protein